MFLSATITVVSCHLSIINRRLNRLLYPIYRIILGISLEMWLGRLWRELYVLHPPLRHSMLNDGLFDWCYCTAGRVDCLTASLSDTNQSSADLVIRPHLLTNTSVDSLPITCRRRQPYCRWSMTKDNFFSCVKSYSANRQRSKHKWPTVWLPCTVPMMIQVLDPHRYNPAQKRPSNGKPTNSRALFSFIVHMKVDSTDWNDTSMKSTIVYSWIHPMQISDSWSAIEIIQTLNVNLLENVHLQHYWRIHRKQIQPGYCQSYRVRHDLLLFSLLEPKSNKPMTIIRFVAIHHIPTK